jgi:hypothetical protein
MKALHEKRQMCARKIWRWYQHAKATKSGKEAGEKIRSEKLCINFRLSYVEKMTGF